MLNPFQKHVNIHFIFFAAFSILDALYAIIKNNTITFMKRGPWS